MKITTWSKATFHICNILRQVKKCLTSWCLYVYPVYPNGWMTLNDYMYIHSSWWLYTYGLSRWMDDTPGLPTFDPRPPRPPRCGRLVLARAGPRLPRQVGRGPESWGISGGTVLVLAGWTWKNVESFRFQKNLGVKWKSLCLVNDGYFFLFKVNLGIKREFKPHACFNMLNINIYGVTVTSKFGNEPAKSGS